MTVYVVENDLRGIMSALDCGLDGRRKSGTDPIAGEEQPGHRAFRFWTPLIGARCVTDGRAPLFDDLEAFNPKRPIGEKLSDFRLE